MKEAALTMKRLAATPTPGSGQTAVDQAICWLKENYIVRVNTIDPSRMYLEKTEQNPREFPHGIREEDILLHAMRDDIPLSRGTLRLILYNPNEMEPFNPVADYLQSLRGQWKGGMSQIDLLARSLHTTDDNQDRTTRLLRKWLVAVAACALGIRQNDVALGLVGAQAGIGKTTFFEQLVPDELVDYYQSVLKNDSTFHYPRAFATRLLLNFDEMAALTPSQEPEFKQMLSALKLQTRRPGDRTVTTIGRIASCCFTSNRTHEQGGFINTADPGMLRRLAVIEVDSIDDYRPKLHIDQLWAEVMQLLDGGFDPTWSQQEYQQFSQENRIYVKETNASRLIDTHYRQPHDDEQGEFMTATDILRQLKRELRISSMLQQVSVETIGRAMVVLGFEQTTSRTERFPHPVKGYYVIPMFNEH